MKFSRKNILSAIISRQLCMEGDFVMRQQKKIIQKFYTTYKRLHMEIEKVLLDKNNSSFYASVILDRMMILYFLQKNGILPENLLINKYIEFERDNLSFHNFLIELFKKINTNYSDRNDCDEIIPYLNLSIFQVTNIFSNLKTVELDYGKILDQFNKYDWKLEEISKNMTVTPKILGSVFEKYINQKDMGAYYTEDDTTEYITSNTIALSVLYKMVDNKTILKNMYFYLRNKPEFFVKKNEFFTYQFEKDFQNSNYHQRVSEIENINEYKFELLIKNNVDIMSLLKFTIENETNPNIIKDIFHALSNLTILDPTCGTGAFVIKALDILLDLFLTIDSKYKNLTNSSLLGEINETNKEFIILKHCIENVLYGVDLMEEAIEILNTRLYLRLLSCFNSDVKSLPEIKTNFKTGNSLIGEVVFPENSQTVEELNIFSFESYQLNILDWEYQEWKKQVKPFHWCLEFSDVIKKGGFDCIIGNPPYIEYSKVKKNQYEVFGYETIRCGNLFAFTLEKSYQLLKDKGILGMIVPISVISTPRMAELRRLLRRNSSYVFYSNFGDRPGTLFTGVHQKLTIIISQKDKNSLGADIYTSKYYHWYQEERNGLFNSLYYIKNNFIHAENDFYYKFNDKEQINIIRKINSNNTSLEKIFSENGNFKLYLGMRMTFWTKAFINKKDSNEFKEFSFNSEIDRNVIMALLNSSLFFFYWECVSDCWHITSKEFGHFKFDINKMDTVYKNRLSKLALQLERKLEENKVYIGSTQTNYEYRHKKCKAIIDEIDLILGNHYGLTIDEINYLKYYQLKYRMNDELDVYLNSLGGKQIECN